MSCLWYCCWIQIRFTMSQHIINIWESVKEAQSKIKSLPFYLMKGFIEGFGNQTEQSLTHWNKYSYWSVPCFNWRPIVFKIEPSCRWTVNHLLLCLKFHMWKIQAKNTNICNALTDTGLKNTILCNWLKLISQLLDFCKNLVTL